MSTTKRDLRWTVYVKDGGRMLSDTPIMNFRADIAIMTREGLTCPASYSADARAPELKHLAVTAQREPGKDWYGWRVSYAEPYRVELPEAEAMVTVLRRIDRGMRRLAERYGSPADLAAFMSHLADVLGCRTAAFGRRATAEHDFDGTG